MKIESKQTSRVVIGIVFASTAIAVACVTSYNPSCYDDQVSITECPDGTHDLEAYTTHDTKTLCENAGGAGYYQTPSSGKCKWDCFYVDIHSVEVGCGTTNFPWNGQKPDTSSPCPQP